MFAVVLYHMEHYLTEKSTVFTTTGVRGYWLHDLIHTGHCGVQLFFVISGFILALPFVESHTSGKSPPKLKKYFTRRVTRLEPPYLINLLAIFSLLVLFKGTPIQELLPHLLASVFYVHNQVYHEFSTINCVAWSLEIEIQFYLLAPFLCSIFILSKPYRRILLVSAMAAFAMWKTISPSENPAIRLSLLYWLDYFLAGLVLADVFVTDWKESTSFVPGADLFAVLGWAAIPVLQNPSILQNQLPAAIPIFDATPQLLPFTILFTYVMSMRSVLIRGLLALPAITVMGGMCYTVYLYHFFVISAVGRFTSALTLGKAYYPTIAVQVPLILTAVILVSGVLFVLFERPFMNRRHKPAFDVANPVEATPLESENLVAS